MSSTRGAAKADGRPSPAAARRYRDRRRPVGGGGRDHVDSGDRAAAARHPDHAARGQRHAARHPRGHRVADLPERDGLRRRGGRMAHGQRRRPRSGQPVPVPHPGAGAARAPRAAHGVARGVGRQRPADRGRSRRGGRLRRLGGCAVALRRRGPRVPRGDRRRRDAGPHAGRGSQPALRGRRGRCDGAPGRGRTPAGGVGGRSARRRPPRCSSRCALRCSPRCRRRCRPPTS